MKVFSIFTGGLMIILALISCENTTSIHQTNSPSQPVENDIEKKSQNIIVDSLNSPTFTPANTTGNFLKGKGSEKKISTEKPNRKRVLQDSTHSFYSPNEFVDETTDPAFIYSPPDQCETILPDTTP
ncbi:MAG: hypothetical protein ACKOX3_08465 [Bacteroidota bacterium]